MSYNLSPPEIIKSPVLPGHSIKTFWVVSFDSLTSSWGDRFYIVEQTMTSQRGKWSKFRTRTVCFSVSSGLLHAGLCLLLHLGGGFPTALFCWHTENLFFLSPLYITFPQTCAAWPLASDLPEFLSHGAFDRAARALGTAVFGVILRNWLRRLQIIDALMRNE